MSDPQILYIQDIIMGGTTARKIAHDTLRRAESNSMGEIFPYFYSKSGRLFDRALNELTMYEVSPEGEITEHHGFVTGRDYFVSSENGHLYDYSGVRMDGEEQCGWSPQLSSNGVLYFLDLSNNGIYAVSDVTSPNPGRIRTDVTPAYPILRVMTDGEGNDRLLVPITNENTGILEIVDIDPSAQDGSNDDIFYPVPEGTEIQDFHIYGSDLYYLDQDFQLHLYNGTILSQPVTESVFQFLIDGHTLYYIIMNNTADSTDMNLYSMDLSS